MPRFICKFPHKGKDYYLEWSSVSDSPISRGMSLAQFKRYYKEEYGQQGLVELPRLLELVESHGTSNLSWEQLSLDELIKHNRAGEGETRLTKAQIIQQYCLDQKIDPNDTYDHLASEVLEGLRAEFGEVKLADVEGVIESIRSLGDL